MNPHEKLLTTDNPILRQRAKAMRQEMSGAEAKLWQHLRAGRLNGYKFRRQQPMGNYIVDFMCVTPKLIVEADGGQHTEQAAHRTSRIRPRADGISQQLGLYRTAVLESRDFTADKRCADRNPARVARIGKASCTIADG